MIIRYSLNKEDYLIYQLFSASKSKKIKAQRRRSYVLLIIAFVLLGFSFFSSNRFYFYVFLLLAISMAIFYPLYQRKRYENHYKKYIEEHQKNLFGKETLLEITGTSINTKSHLGEAKLNTTIIENITETQDYFFIRLDTGSSFIIPKRIDEVEVFKNYLKEFSKSKKIDYIEDLDWKWK